MGNEHTRLTTDTRQPFNLYRISISNPPIILYGSAKKRSGNLMMSLSRLIPPDSIIALARVENVIGRHFVPWSTVIYDRSRFTRYQKSFFYSGPPPATIETLDQMSGRAHQFTPKEKRKTYMRVLERYPYLEPMDLTPLMDYVFMTRSELTFGREMARNAGRLGRPRHKQKKLKEKA